jgi:hypothetical protein
MPSFYRVAQCAPIRPQPVAAAPARLELGDVLLALELVDACSGQFAAEVRSPVLAVQIGLIPLAARFEVGNNRSSGRWAKVTISRKGEAT